MENSLKVAIQPSKQRKTPLMLTAIMTAGFALTTANVTAGEPGKKAAAAMNSTGAIPVEIVMKDGKFQVYRDGKPYRIKGAGLEFGDMQALADNGGNSFRTWRTDNGVLTGQQVLDRALELGLTVFMCIEIGRERQGFDYNDEAAVAAQFEYARGEVMKYKDHPALLAWMIGNEPNLFFENPKVFDAINDISEMIHELDDQHPTSTALAGFDAKLAGLIEERSPDLDFVSIQMYGDIVNLPQRLRDAGWDKPYMVTEWGAIGHWEVGTTEWDAPIEQDSSSKAASYLNAWETALKVDEKNLLGDYVFLWGQKQERTPTWYGMFLPDGSSTETVDVLQTIWTGEPPENGAPRVSGLTLNDARAEENVRFSAGESAMARVTATDPDSDQLMFHWEIMRESTAKQAGGDLEYVPEAIPGLVTTAQSGMATMTAPSETGAYRLFVYVRDGHGKAGHANIPFFVE